MERPGQLWHLDMTVDLGRRARLGLPERDHRLLHPRDRRLGAHLRCRAVEAIAVIERRSREQGIRPGTLTLGTDNGSAFTARATRLVISGLGVAHRRGGYRDPESQAFIESWFRYLKERCVWRHEFETLDQAREVIAAYIDHYHHRPHSRLDYRTPAEVRQTWDDAQDQLQKHSGLNRQHHRGALQPRFGGWSPVLNSSGRWPRTVRISPASAKNVRTPYVRRRPAG